MNYYCVLYRAQRNSVRIGRIWGKKNRYVASIQGTKLKHKQKEIQNWQGAKKDSQGLLLELGLVICSLFLSACCIECLSHSPIFHHYSAFICFAPVCWGTIQGPHMDTHWSLVRRCKWSKLEREVLDLVQWERDVFLSSGFKTLKIFLIEYFYMCWLNSMNFIVSCIFSFFKKNIVLLFDREKERTSTNRGE